MPPDAVILDSGANVSCTPVIDSLKGRIALPPMHINGVGQDGVYAHSMGDHPLWGRMYVVPEASATLPSLADIAEQFTIVHNNRTRNTILVGTANFYMFPMHADWHLPIWDGCTHSTSDTSQLQRALDGAFAGSNLDISLAFRTPPDAPRACVLDETPAMMSIDAFETDALTSASQAVGVSPTQSSADQLRPAEAQPATPTPAQVLGVSTSDQRTRTIYPGDLTVDPDNALTKRAISIDAFESDPPDIMSIDAFEPDTTPTLASQAVGVRPIPSTADLLCPAEAQPATPVQEPGVSMSEQCSRTHYHGVLPVDPGFSGPILSKSRKREIKRKIITRSTAKSELMAFAESLTVPLLACRMLIELGYPPPPLPHPPDKWARIDSGEVHIVYLPTVLILPDLMTKNIQGDLFRTMDHYRKDAQRPAAPGRAACTRRYRHLHSVWSWGCAIRY
jgi:hypothetical protein